MIIEQLEFSQASLKVSCSFKAKLMEVKMKQKKKKQKKNNNNNKQTSKLCT